MTDQPSKSLFLTEHTRVRLKERGIESDWVRRTILDPVLAEDDPAHDGRRRAFRPVPEFGDRLLRVVYVEDETSIRVVTATFDRNRGRRLL